VKFINFTTTKRKTMKNKINNASLLLLLVTAFFFNSCDKDQIVPFDIEILNFPVAAGPLTHPTGNEKFLTTVFTTETEQKLNELGASFDDIESAKLKSLKLRITGPATRTFDQIDFCDAWAFATDIPEEKIAYSDAIPKTGLKEYEFNSQFNDLSKFVKKDQFSVYVQGQHNVPFADSTFFEVDLVITVKVKTKE
jgi:hypothetical protein